MQLPASPNEPRHRGRPITRALLLQRLYDPDERELEHYSEDQEEPSTEPLNLARRHDGPETSDTVWEDTRYWLDHLCKAEESRIDWSLAYDRRRLSALTDDNGLPIYLAQKNISNVQDRLLGVREPSKLGMNTDVLERISKGLGPRPRKVDDLLAPLRQSTLNQDDSSESSSSSSSRAVKTYDELRTALRAWNDTLYVPVDISEARSELLLALSERSHVLTSIIREEQDISDLYEQSTSLIRALIAYRPEIATFEKKDPYNIMVVMIANVRVAEPNLELDFDVFDSLLRTLMIEVKLRLDPRLSARKASVKLKLESSERMGNREAVEHWGNELKGLNFETLTQGRKRLIDDIKTARRNLRKRVLEEMEELTVLQASQKMFLADYLSFSLGLLEHTCEEADAGLRRTLQRHDLEAQQEASERVVKSMTQLNWESHQRVDKFAALDIPDPVARERTRRRRLNNPGTAAMMLKVVQANDVVGKAAEGMLRRLDDMSSSLEEIYSAAGRQFQEYDALYNTIGEVVDEAAKAEGTG